MTEQDAPDDLHIRLPVQGEVPVAPMGSGPQEILSNLESVASGAARRIVEDTGTVRERDRLQTELDDEKIAHQKTLDLVRSTARLALEFKNTAETLEENVTRDDLTGLLNQKGLRETYKQFAMTRNRLQARDQTNTDSVIFIDLDKFADLNSSLGHDGADEVLKAIARLMEKNTRSTDIRVRRSGDEFIIVLPDTSLETASTIGDNLRLAIEKSEEIKNTTASIGVAAINPNAISKSIKQANKAMFEAKKSGRNQTKVAKELPE